MLSYFSSDDQKKLIECLIRITAKLDDEGLGLNTNPFKKMTRSPYHLLAWFILYAATKTNIIPPLQQLFAEHQDYPLAKDALALKSLIDEVIQSEALLEILSKNKDKISLLCNIDPLLFIGSIRTNGFEKLALLLDSLKIIEFDASIDGLSVVTTVEGAVQWSRELSESKPGFLSIETSPEDCMIGFFAFCPASKTFKSLDWHEAIVLASQSNFDVTGDIHAGDSFEDRMSLHIPLPAGGCALAQEIKRQEVNAGLYNIFNFQDVGTIVTGSVKVFIQGKAWLDKRGASVQQIQEVEIYRGSSPKSVSLTFKEQPSALFVNEMIGVNFSDSMAISSQTRPLLLVRLKTQNAGTELLLSPEGLNSIDSFLIVKLIEQREMIFKNLLKLIKGKPARDGGVFSGSYTEYYLFAELLIDGIYTDSPMKNGLLFNLNNLTIYKHYYESGDYSLSEELPYLIRAILSNSEVFTNSQTNKITSLCKVTKNYANEPMLFLGKEVLDIFAQYNISPAPKAQSKMSSQKDDCLFFTPTATPKGFNLQKEDLGMENAQKI